MSGPFTTITVEQYHAFVDVLHEAEQALQNVTQNGTTLTEDLGALILAVERCKALTNK